MQGGAVTAMALDSGILLGFVPSAGPEVSGASMRSSSRSVFSCEPILKTVTNERYGQPLRGTFDVEIALSWH